MPVKGCITDLLPGTGLGKTEINALAGKFWLNSEEGILLLDVGVGITASPVSEDSWWKTVVSWILPGNIWVSGVVNPEVRYERLSDQSDPYSEAIRRDFEIIIETDKEKYDNAVKVQGYISLDRAKPYVTTGNTTFYISVRDKEWKNTFEHKVSGLVVPTSVVFPIFLSSSWLLLLIMAVALAPFSTFCHNVIMNPWVRSIGSFGLVPLALTVFPPVRRYIFRRYSKTILEDEGFAIWQKKFVIPSDEFSPERIGAIIEKQRRILLTGQSGIGKTSYFKYLTGFYALRENSRTLGNVIPVFLPLSRYQDKLPEDILYAQLANYGRITDKELSAWFLQQGGFLIFIDGLNEVDEATRNRINSFVDQHWMVNQFCISSQEAYPEFAGIHRLELVPLGQVEIKKIIELQLDRKMVSAVFQQLDALTYEVYKIPQDLEFAIDILKQGQPLPLSKGALYEAILSPIFEVWIKDGHSDYPELLFRRAYDMLTSRDAFFDHRENPLPDELQNRLVERKFLIRRDGRYYFRPDLIRAYLASRYLGPRWRNLLKEKVIVDSNWHPVFDFVILASYNSNDVKDLIYMILRKAPRLAGDLFSWIDEQHPALCKDWTEEFDRRYGKAMRQRLHQAV